MKNLWHHWQFLWFCSLGLQIQLHTCLHHTIKHTVHAHTPFLSCGGLVKNRTWLFRGRTMTLEEIFQAQSPQGHSLQAAAAAAAAITALHLPAPFNWLMLFDMSEQSSQLASRRLQLGPRLNAAKNFAKPWYEVTARLKSIRRTWLKAAVLPHASRMHFEFRDRWMHIAWGLRWQ